MTRIYRDETRCRMGAFLFAVLLIAVSLRAQASDGSPEVPDWLQTARVFLIDAYYPPMAPEMEFDAEALAETMEAMNVNTVRMATMGKYATIQAVRFSPHPDQGDRDLPAEMIAACKPRGIRVAPYISTDRKLAWSMVTEDYAEYNCQQRIFTSIMFTGAPIMAQPHAYVNHPEYRRYVTHPLGVLAANERNLAGFENYPYVR